MVQNNVVTLKDLTCSIMRELSHLCRASFQRSPSLLYRWQFSQSNCFSSWWRVWAGITMMTGLTDWEGLTHPLTEADHRPHGAAQGAAAAQTPEQQPADVDWQSLPECDVDPCDGRLVRGEHWLVDIFTLYIPWTLPGPLGSVKTAEILCRICLKDQI